MSNTNDTIFREVDEELRGDRLRAFWRRFGPYLIGGAVAVVVIVAANEGWNWWQTSSAARASDQYYAALEQAEAGDIAGAQTALNEVVSAGNGGYPTLARFRQASLLVRDGKPAEALAAYDALAASETNPRLRELALVLAAFLAVDTADVAAVQQRVGGLDTPENPMRNAAREAIGLAQYRAGDLDAALVAFEAVLGDPVVTQEARQRVQIYVAQLVALGAGADAAAETPAAEASEASDDAATEAPATDASDTEAPAADASDTN